jgi:hypothetical protein
MSRAVFAIVGTNAIDFTGGESFERNVGITLRKPIFGKSPRLFGSIEGRIQFVGCGGGEGDTILHGSYFLSLVGKTIIQYRKGFVKGLEKKKVTC